MRTAFVVAWLAVGSSAGPTNERAEEALRESVLRLAAGDVSGARAQAEAAVAVEPSSPRALQQLSRAASAALDFPAAEAAAEKAMAAGGITPALLCLRSEARAGRGDYAGALADAERAAALDPGGAAAFLRRAVAREGLRRPAEDVLADYRRAAEFDASNAPLRDAAQERLQPPARPAAGGWGGLAAILVASGFAGWAWGRLRRRGELPMAALASRPALPGTGLLSAREAARLVAAVADQARDADGTLALAESLYQRLTGREPYAPNALVARSQGSFAAPSSLIGGLPAGIDAFFIRAFNPDPARRFRSGAELAGAFRSLVEPAVD